jgi:hypothetical protein
MLGSDGFPDGAKLCTGAAAGNTLLRCRLCDDGPVNKALLVRLVSCPVNFAARVGVRRLGMIYYIYPDKSQIRNPTSG